MPKGAPLPKTNKTAQSAANILANLLKPKVQAKSGNVPTPTPVKPAAMPYGVAAPIPKTYPAFDASKYDLSGLNNPSLYKGAAALGGIPATVGPQTAPNVSAIPGIGNINSGLSAANSAAKSVGHSVGSGSSGAGSLAGAAPIVEAPPAPNPVDAITQLYSLLQGGLNNQKIQGDVDYTDAKNSINSNWDTAGKNLLNQYMTGRNQVSDQAAGLGVNLDNSTLGRQWDDTTRNLQSQQDSARGTDQSFVDKLKLLRDANYESRQSGAMQSGTNAEAALTSALAQAAQAALSVGSGGSSGGGRKRSGGSGSGSSGISGSDTATQTSTVNNVGDDAILNALAATDPAAAAAFKNAYYLGGGSASSALAKSQDLSNTIAAQKTGSWIPQVAKQATANKNKKVDTQNKATAALAKLVGVLGNVATSNKVTSTSKQKV